MIRATKMAGIVSFFDPFLSAAEITTAASVNVQHVN